MYRSVAMWYNFQTSISWSTFEAWWSVHLTWSQRWGKLSSSVTSVATRWRWRSNVDESPNPRSVPTVTPTTRTRWSTIDRSSLINNWSSCRNHQVREAQTDRLAWLVVFSVPSIARSFRDGTPYLLSLAKDVKLGFYTVPPGIKPRAVTWQSIQYLCTTPAPSRQTYKGCSETHRQTD